MRGTFGVAYYLARGDLVATPSAVWIVTGASGFVGGHVLSELSDAERAVGLYRSAAPAGGRRVSSWTKDELRAALEGATGVVHSAAVVHRPGAPDDEYVRFNVDGTHALIEAARSVGVKRFVFMSSIKVHGEDLRGTIDENTPIAEESAYAATKARAERIVLEAADLRPVVLRLCPVFGRGDKGNVRTMIRAIARRRFVVPGRGATKKSIVHVSTVAKVVRAAATRDATGTFVVADRTTPTIRELADTISDALGRRRAPSIPLPLVRGAAELVGRVARRLGRSTPISGELIDKSTRDSLCDPSRVTRDLGVDPHVDLAWAIRDEIDWLRSERIL